MAALSPAGWPCAPAPPLPRCTAPSQNRGRLPRRRHKMTNPLLWEHSFSFAPLQADAREPSVVRNENGSKRMHPGKFS